MAEIQPLEVIEWLKRQFIEAGLPPWPRLLASVGRDDRPGQRC